MIIQLAMQVKEPDSEGYWSSELGSLGISKKKSELNSKEMRDLVENVKQVLLQEYRTAYSDE